jgi:O-acetyl-ADP-ribose deacetylase (regulator of RNase III)
MDILLIQASAYELPTSRRVGVIVHDGAIDTRLWKGPGSDRELAAAYGPDLQQALDRERAKTGQKVLPIPGLLRLHPGRLHCDFFLWIGTRAPESEGRQAPAPDKATLEAAVRAVLDYVAERHVIRVAFPALGAGPSAIDDAERLATIARACGAWYEQRFASGKASGIEEVLICDARLSVVTSARRMTASLVKVALAEPRPGASANGSSDKRAPSEKRAGSAGGAKKASPRGAAARKPRLDEGEIGRARATAKPWDRAARYGIGDYFVHAKFGVGRVDDLTPDGFVVVLFEDGDTRKMVHARP